MRLSDRALLRDPAPAPDRRRLGAVAPAGRERGHDVNVGVVRPASRRSLDALHGRPIVVGRRAGGPESLPSWPVGGLRIGADVLAARRERVRHTPAPRAPRLALVGSVALHLAAIVMLAPWPGGPLALAPEAQQRQIEMVFVQQPQTTRGAPPARVDAAAKPDIKTAVASSLSLPMPPAGAPSPSAASPTTPPAGAAAPHWQTSMLDDPGDAPDDAAAYAATSDDLRPARPDSAYRNLPPRYPADAARRGQRGVVDIIVHVTPDGRAGRVEVAASSGVASLDHAAVRALSAWRFQPQRSGGVPVPSQFRIAVNYDGSAP